MRGCPQSAQAAARNPRMCPNPNTGALTQMPYALWAIPAQPPHCTWAAHTGVSPLWMPFSPAPALSPQTRSPSLHEHLPCLTWTESRCYLPQPAWSLMSPPRYPPHPHQVVAPTAGSPPSTVDVHLAPPHLNGFRIKLFRKGRSKL